MNKKEWARIRETIEFTYYHHKPFSTICIAQVVINGVSRMARGISIVYPSDHFCRRKGRAKAAGWAERALFHEEDMYGTSKSQEVVNRAYYVMQDLFPFNYCNKDKRRWVSGFYCPILTEFEKQILSKKRTKAIPLEKTDAAKPDGNS